MEIPRVTTKIILGLLPERIHEGMIERICGGISKEFWDVILKETGEEPMIGSREKFLKELCERIQEEFP